MPKRGKTPLWVFLSVAFVILQTVDAVLTSIGVNRYGLEMEANPIAALLFAHWGTWQAAIAVKLLSAFVFFGLLWYCLKVRWTMLDVIGLLWGRKPKRDEAYAMKCFYLVAIVVTLASLYAGGGWMYLLMSLSQAH